MSKIFVIGCNKTATTTLHRIFLRNNLMSQHATRWDLENYECFSDNGDMKNVERLDIMYPGSIYILNTRSLKGWLCSRFKHGDRYSKPNWASPCTLYKCAQWAQHRHAHHCKVLNYFTNKPEQLIIVDIDLLGWERYLCDKLNLPIHDIPPAFVRPFNNTQSHKLIIKTVEAYFKQTQIAPSTNLTNHQDVDLDMLSKYNNRYINI